MAKRKKNIIEKPIEIVYEDGIFLPKYIKEELNPKFVKQYEESIPVLRNLSGQDRSLLDFFLKEMNSENHFSTSSFFLQKYIDESEKADVKSTSIASLKKNIKNLKNSGLIFSFQRGIKIANPKYFFKGSEEDRAALLKEIYDKQMQLTVNEFAKNL